MSDLPIMTVREFRAKFSRLTHPVRVIRAKNTKVLGVYYPVTDSTGVRYAADQPNSERPERTGEG